MKYENPVVVRGVSNFSLSVGATKVAPLVSLLKAHDVTYTCPVQASERTLHSDACSLFM